MNTTNQIPATQNEEWGFWGTMNQHAAAAWPIALPAIAETTGTSLDAVRAFLDSYRGPLILTVRIMYKTGLENGSEFQSHQILTSTHHS